MLVKKFGRLAVALTVVTIVLSCPLILPHVQGAEKSVDFETGLYYTIKQGDTLWDVAEHFYGTPAAWPEVWRQNPHIANPHRLKPGTQIRIFGETRTQKITVAEQPSDTEIAPPPPYYLYNSIDAVGFIRKEPITSRGKIFGVKFSVLNSKDGITEDDIVYIKPADGVKMVPGESFYVYRKLKAVYDPKRVNLGPQYYVTGIAEIVNLEPDFVAARIIRSFREIHVNDQLLPYAPRSPKIVIKQSPPGVEGYLLKSEEGTLNFAEGDVAFIDKGHLNQIKVGQIYTVFHAAPFPEATVRTRLGSLLILHTEKYTSTVLVVQSEKSLRAGVRIGTPLP